MSSSSTSKDQTDNLKPEIKSPSESLEVCHTDKSGKMSKSHALMGTMLTSMDFLGNKYTTTNCIRCNTEFRRMSLDNGRICGSCDIERQMNETE